MPTLRESVPTPVLKALYAGYKYHLCLNSKVDGFSKGQPDTPTNIEMICQYYSDWENFTKEAVDLLDADDEGRLP